MTVVVFGIDALDPELVDQKDHPHLTLKEYKPIKTILSSKGDPSTHELWPTIITGLDPEDHGLTLDDGITWANPILRTGSKVGDFIFPDSIQTKLGAVILNRTSADAFRTSASYYKNQGLNTIFDGHIAKAIGIPNYVTELDSEDREHQLRRNMGELFERDPGSEGGHVSANPDEFYEQCLEMIMIRTARIRRGLRSSQYELVFGYTSGLDLIGHISFDRPTLQKRAYDELNDFVGELRNDLQGNDELILVSDHGLQDGLHTDEAMIAATDPAIVESVSSVLEIRETVEKEMDSNDHLPELESDTFELNNSPEVQEQLEDLGYM